MKKSNIVRKSLLFYFTICLFLTSISLVSAAVLNVCSSCSYITIQSAINNATNGDVINVSAGTYVEDLVINSSKNNIEIKGVGTSSVIKGVANSDAGVPPSGEWPLARPNIEINADNVKIHDLVIENPDYQAGKYSSGVVIGGKNIEIYSIDFKIPGATNSDEVSQSIQTYHKSAKPGVDISGLNIHNNTFVNKDAGSWGYEGIYINPDTGAGFINIQNNNFNGKILRAITSERSKINIKNNNIITELPISADDLSSAGGYQGINIRNYNLENQSQVFIEKNTIKGSDSSKGFNQGIRIGQTGQLFSEIEIKNNTINYNKNGILVKVSEGVKIDYNSISGNNIGVKNDNAFLLNAKNNWWGDCTGPSGAGSGSGDGVSVNVDFTPWLGACILNKAVDKTCVISYDDVKLYANVSSLVCVGKVWFGVNINGTWKNYTASPTGGIGNYFVLLKSGNFTGGETVYWTVFTDDCYNHISQDGTENFYVNRKTELIVSPLNPDGENGWYIIEPLFTLINPDAGAIFYRWDGSGNLLYSGSFGLDDIPNQPSESAGLLELKWFGNLSCSQETLQSKSFKIDLTSPVIKDLVPKNNEIIYNNLRPTIQAYLDEVYGENSGIDKSNIVMKVNGVIVNKNVIDREKLDALVRYNPENDLLIGINNVSVSAKDKAGRISELTWYFNIDNSVTDFNLSVFFPENGFYDTKRIKINITTSKIVDKIDYMNSNEPVKKWKSLCSKCIEFGNLRQKALLLLEGESNITIRARDSFGNEKRDNRSIFIDSIKPKISLIKPNKNSYFNGSEFSIKYSEENLKEIILFYGRGEDIRNVTKLDCEKGKNKVCVFSGIDLRDFDGVEIIYWFSVSDVIRTVDSKMISVHVDISPPFLDVFNPLNEDIYTGDLRGNVLFNITTGENSKIEYYDFSSLLPSNWKVLCSNCNKYIRNKKFLSGNHDLLIRATDKAGNSAVQEINFFVEPYDNRLIIISE